MGFAKKKDVAPRISADRLASVAGAASPAAATAPEPAAPRERLTVEPDLSRIRSRVAAMETPEERKRRMTAKVMNFTATILARLIIMAAIGFLIYGQWQGTGTIHRGYAMGMFAMVADFGRVMMKCMEPGTK